MRIGAEVELLISSYEFDLYAGAMVTIVNIIYESTGCPVLAIIMLDDCTTRRVCIDHIRLPK